MPEYYHVRISPKRVDVMTDFSIFFTEILATREGRWDKDSKNRIVVGDYLGFITGPVGEEVVYIYKVEREGTADERPSHWASATPYTSNNGQTAVSDRQVIILTNKHTLPKTFEWRKFRSITGLGGKCVAWAPRGTQRVADKKALPFQIEEPVEEKKSIRV
jgi:hypothetical protein